MLHVHFILNELKFIFMVTKHYFPLVYKFAPDARMWVSELWRSVPFIPHYAKQEINYFYIFDSYVIYSNRNYLLEKCLFFQFNLLSHEVFNVISNIIKEQVLAVTKISFSQSSCLLAFLASQDKGIFVVVKHLDRAIITFHGASPDFY